MRPTQIVPQYLQNCDDFQFIYPNLWIPISYLLLSDFNQMFVFEISNIWDELIMKNILAFNPL